MVDYDILFNNIKIGNLNINENENNIFIRHIDIDKHYRRCGHARKVIDYMFFLFKKNISFCIATNSESAINFWNKILIEKENVHIKGNVYELIFR